jgi:hypothetical protein
MTASTRTDSLFSALSAKERAVLVLRAWKEGSEEDRQVRAMMPLNQVDSFNHYIELMNSVNERLGHYLLVLRANVEQLGLISGWLATMRLWGIDVFQLGLFIFRNVPEPITASEHARLKRPRGHRDPVPDRGLRYAVYPDTDSGKVKELAKERAAVWESFGRAPCPVFADEVDEPSRLQEAFQALVDRLKRQVAEYWGDLRSIEMLVAEAIEEFGEDPALPEIRQIIDWMRRELNELRDMLKASYGVEVVLPEPSDDQIAILRQVGRWPLESHGLTINLAAPDH